MYRYEPITKRDIICMFVCAGIVTLFIILLVFFSEKKREKDNEKIMECYKITKELDKCSRIIKGF